MIEYIQLKVSLKDTVPEIWRRLQVNRKTTFIELHHSIQIAMGWKNSHLFEFNLDGYRVGTIYENLEDSGRDVLLDAGETLLTHILSMENDRFTYNYVFGDCWLHEITLEQLISTEEKVNYPVCLDGALSCPPEDCGGIGGFYNLLKILADKKHPEYKETRYWVGRKYNHEAFDLIKTNKQLKQLKRYINRFNSFN